MYMSPLGIGITLFFLALIALSWPYRHERHFTFRRHIAAPRERIWDAYKLDLDVPDSAKLHHHVKSVTPIETNPTIKEIVIDSSGGHGTVAATLHMEVLTNERPWLDETRTRLEDGTPFPFGENHLDRLELEDAEAGTLATLTWRGETSSLWQSFNIWWSHHRHLKDLTELCETGQLDTSTQSRRSSWIRLGLSLLAVGSFTYLLGWVGGLLLAGITVVHEYGHWLAMRITGQPAPRVMLIPFFGGAAVANHPHKSLFDDAFCTLMGPGFSVLPCSALLIATAFLGLPDMDQGLDGLAPPGVITQEMIGLGCLAVATLIGLLNGLQLVPVLPLDGGHILRSLIQSFSGHWARWTMLLVTGLAIAALIYTRDYLIAALLGLGALQAWYMKTERTGSRPMNPVEFTAICLGYLATLGLYGITLVYWLGHFGI